MSIDNKETDKIALILTALIMFDLITIFSISFLVTVQVREHTFTNVVEVKQWS